MNQKVRSKGLGLLVVVGGPGSSGSSTIALMLSQYFSLKRIYGGSIFREYLEKYGYEDLERAYFSDNEFLLEKADKYVDAKLLNEVKNKNILIESKVFAAYATVNCIPCTVKIWVDANIFVRAQRALLKQGLKLSLKTIPLYFVNLYNLIKRYRIDRMRYNKLYGIKYQLAQEYNDIVIDTSRMNESESFKLILKYIKNGGYIKK